MTDFMGGKALKSPLERGEPKARGVSDTPQNTNTPSVNSVATFLEEGQSNELFASTQHNFVPTKPLEFSPQATAVFDAGRELWRYYYENWETKHTPSAIASTPLAEGTMGNIYNPNASLYDIREHFQGRNESGKMNNKSSDEKYNALITNLRESLKVLATKIQPKVYEYGFLRK